MTNDTSVGPDAARRVLIFVKGTHEGNLTRRLLEEARLVSELCRDAACLCNELSRGAGALLLAEEVLTEPLLKQLAQAISQQGAWSDLPILIFSAPRDDSARGAASAALGNVTFLDRPIHVRTMVAAVQSALRSRERQYEARRAIESRDAFLAMLGHELRNPLGAITFALAALARKNGDAAQPKEHALMDRQVRHLSRLVDELLDVARVTHGKVAIERRQVDLTEVAQAAFDAFEARAREQSLGYQLKLHEQPLFVFGDPQRLEQVIGNLLTNAIKYTERGGQVTLEIGGSDGSDDALIAVEDNGVGLAADMRERIFAPFAQVDSTLDRSQGGLGLGLALVQSIVALHGGRARALSAGLGLGARFEISLPRAQQAERSAPRATRPPADRSLLRIVLVEDNPDIRDLLTELLSCSGHSVTPTEDGPSGLEALLSLEPDLAFVDLGLPGFDGYELARRARASGSHARLIALSGYGQKEDKRRASEAGFDEHLVKPVDNDEIRKAIARASA